MSRISRAAEAGESEPWAALRVLSDPYMARSERGASLRAVSVLVGPMSERQAPIALSPESSSITTGPDDMKPSSAG